MNSISFHYEEHEGKFIFIFSRRDAEFGTAKRGDCPPFFLNATFSRAENKLWRQPPSEHVDFIQAVQNLTKTTYSPEDIHPLSTAMHLGNISMRVGRKIKWDSTTQTIQNDDEADQYLSCPLRQPWTFDA
jgi:hypothetical protein